MVNIVFISPCAVASGNKTTTDRLLSIFAERLGHSVIHVRATEAAADKLHTDNTTKRVNSATKIRTLWKSVDLCIALHAYRCAALLLDDDHDVGNNNSATASSSCTLVPLIVIFGGTDVNEMSSDPERMARMTAVIQRSAALVCFSVPLRDKASILWPNAVSKMHIIAQSVAVPDDYRLRIGSSSGIRTSDHFALCCSWSTPTDSVQLNQQCLLKDPSSSSIPSVCDCQMLHSMFSTPTVEQPKLFVLPAGLRAVKDPLFLCEAMTQWHDHDPQVFLVIVGPGIEGSITNEIHKWSNHQGIIYIPIMNQNCLYKLISSALCIAVINSSRSEGQPQAILEAMSIGKPVLVRNISGNTAVVTHRKTGLVYSTAEEFILQANELLVSTTLSSNLISEGLEYINTNHNIEKETLGYNSIISSLLLT
jgi:glycosyltransferase involved in cell wall biosynthesis